MSLSIDGARALPSAVEAARSIEARPVDLLTAVVDEDDDVVGR